MDELVTTKSRAIQRLSTCLLVSRAFRKLDKINAPWTPILFFSSELYYIFTRRFYALEVCQTKFRRKLRPCVSKAQSTEKIKLVTAGIQLLCKHRANTDSKKTVSHESKPRQRVHFERLSRIEIKCSINHKSRH